MSSLFDDSPDGSIPEAKHGRREPLLHGLGSGITGVRVVTWKVYARWGTSGSLDIWVYSSHKPLPLAILADGSCSTKHLENQRFPISGLGSNWQHNLTQGQKYDTWTFSHFNTRQQDCALSTRTVPQDQNYSHGALCVHTNLVEI